MKHGMALLLALILVFCATACAEAFTPITVDGSNYLNNLDTCIAIRLVYKKNGEICIRSGAGIVADSVPEKEFEECCNKARAVRAAIKQAEEGLE